MSSSGTADAGMMARPLSQPDPTLPRAALNILALPRVVALMFNGLLTDVVPVVLVALLALTTL